MLSESESNLSINRKSLFKKSNTLVGNHVFREESVNSSEIQTLEYDNPSKEIDNPKSKKENENKNVRRKLVKSDSIDNSDYLSDYHQPVCSLLLKSKRNILKSSAYKTRLGCSLENQSHSSQNISLTTKNAKSIDNFNLATIDNNNEHVVKAEVHHNFGKKILPFSI